MILGIVGWIVVGVVVGGDHHVTAAAPPGDPVIGGVGAPVDHDQCHGGILRRADPVVRNDVDWHRISPSDAVDFLLHRAGIGVDEEGGQRKAA